MPEIQNLRALIETYLARREAEGRLRPSSLVGEQRQLSIFKNAMGDRLLSDIDARDISAMIEREAARLRKRGGPATNANRILGVVRRVFKKAIGWGLYQGPNPAAVVSRPVSEKPRERVLFDGQALRSREHPELNEIGPLLRSLRAEKGAVGGELETRVALEIALFMGMRASEICMLEWKNVRLDDAIPTLTIATGKTKNAARTLPLPAAIAARFNELKARGGKKARCVFPARADAERAEHLHAESLSRAFRRAAAALNIDGVTLHDLRRTVLSAIIELTGDESLAERIAGHGRRSTLSRHYDRSQRLEPMLAALTQWAETLEQVATARQ